LPTLQEQHWPNTATKTQDLSSVTESEALKPTTSTIIRNKYRNSNVLLS